MGMPMQERYVWAGLVLMLGIGVIGWNAVTPVNQASVAPLARPVHASFPGMVPRPPARQVSGDAALEVQIAQLVATHDPEDAYAAYWLIANCETFNREHDRMIFDEEEVTQHRNMIPYRGMNDSEKQRDTKLCAGMSERTRVSRFDYLASAAKAGISGAVIQMAAEGPFGDRSALATRPDDPLVQEWKAKVLDQLAKEAEGGDLLTLNYLWVHALSGDELVAKNPALAYRYVVARGLIDGDVNGPQATEATMYAPEGTLMASMFDLSAEQRTAERAAAQRIADNARERRRREAKEPSRTGT
jgi:hypothetical protein